MVLPRQNSEQIIKYLINSKLSLRYVCMNWCSGVEVIVVHICYCCCWGRWCGWNGSGARDDGDDDDKLTLTYHGPEGWPAGTESTGVEVVVVHVVMHVVMGRRLGLLWHLTATPTHSNIKHQTLTTLPLSAHVIPSVYPHTHHLQYTHTTTSTRKNQSAQVHWIISPAIHIFRIDPFFGQQTVSKSTNKRPVHIGQHCVLVLLGHKSGDWKLCNSLIFHCLFIDLLSVARGFI